MAGISTCRGPGPAINAGDDHVIDHRYASHVIDHGEMSDEQAARYMEQQGRPIFPSYETSGYDRSNCVHAHSYGGSNLSSGISNTTSTQRRRTWPSRCAA